MNDTEIYILVALGAMLIGAIISYIVVTLWERKIRKKLLKNPDLIDYPIQEAEKEVYNGEDQYRGGIKEPSSGYIQPTIPRFSEGSEPIQSISSWTNGSNARNVEPTSNEGRSEGNVKSIRRKFKPI